MEWELEDGNALVKDVERILLIASVIVSMGVGIASLSLLVALAGQ